MHTISAEQLLKAYNGKYKYVTMDSLNSVSLWVDKPNYGNAWWVPKTENLLHPKECLGKIAITEFQNKPWHECIYKAKPSEEDMIGCVGFFGDAECKILGILSDICHDLNYPYKDQDGNIYKQFRPATRDEIKFFNDDTSEE